MNNHKMLLVGSVLAWEDDLQAFQCGTLGSSSEEGPLLTTTRQHLAPSSTAPLSTPVANEGLNSLINSCDQAVVQTVLNVHAKCTRILHDNRWKLFVSCFESQWADLGCCPVTILLNFFARNTGERFFCLHYQFICQFPLSCKVIFL